MKKFLMVFALTLSFSQAVCFAREGGSTSGGGGHGHEAQCASAVTSFVQENGADPILSNDVMMACAGIPDETLNCIVKAAKGRLHPSMITTYCTMFGERHN